MYDMAFLSTSPQVEGNKEPDQCEDSDNRERPLIARRKRQDPIAEEHQESADHRKMQRTPEHRGDHESYRVHRGNPSRDRSYLERERGECLGDDEPEPPILDHML